MGKRLSYKDLLEEMNSAGAPQQSEEQFDPNAYPPQPREPFYPTPDGKAPQPREPFYPTPDGKAPQAPSASIMTSNPRSAIAPPSKVLPKPNTPRDPEDPREKLKKYLEDRMGAQERTSMDPEYRQMARAPQQTLDDSNRDLGLSNLLMRSAAQFGNVAGKTPDTAPYQDYTKNLMAQNSAVGQGIQNERAQAKGLDDENLKVKEFLADRAQKSEDKTLDRDIKAQNLQREIADRAQAQRNWEADYALKQRDQTLKADKETGEGQKQVDKDYAKKYVDWKDTDKAAYENNKVLMESALQEASHKLSNPFFPPRLTGAAPEWLRSEDSKTIQRKIQQAAIGQARAALGAAFTAKENFQIQALHYDPSLSYEANKANIERDLSFIVEAAKHKEALANYWETHNHSLAGLGNSTEAAAAPGSPQAPHAGVVKAPRAGGSKKPLEQMSQEELDAYEASLGK